MPDREPANVTDHTPAGADPDVPPGPLAPMRLVLGRPKSSSDEDLEAFAAAVLARLGGPQAPS